MNNTQTTAHTNIALIKYWGKKDSQLRLPYNDSLSLTLDGYYTTTSTKFIDQADDQIWLNQKPAPLAFATRVQHFLDYVRQLNHSKQAILVQTDNHVPTAAGLASSASGFAALAGSLNYLFQMHLDLKTLSILARHGSGSATRSIFGGFVRWYHGHDDQSSFAEEIDGADQMPLRIISVVFSDQPKKISSTKGMQQAVSTSPFYRTWPTTVQQDLTAMLQAIKQRDLEQIGLIAQNNALAMHALNWTARPAFSYFTMDTIHLLTSLNELRQKGYLAYATIDAGPNVKVLTSTSDAAFVQQYLYQNYPQATTTFLKPGPGIKKTVL
ncbi:diphosphomevalonate decarboxylase [Bombilactobacillus folatiphilus]|uniref:diphosphomevalonate decarboxylase n=1 Tax=Bombilactobacillus folatiphilus TaxID=2923362 RepID=A0ABY4P7J0_9LACO|nr:diphosphomevalonate decarboxylase [Bombilactobacillus folatiphilus]UQS81501.1 diphosphomevalonate decarboxylase [Bombilactobacillus folatiphilus]